MKELIDNNIINRLKCQTCLKGHNQIKVVVFPPGVFNISPWLMVTGLLAAAVLSY